MIRSLDELTDIEKLSLIEISASRLSLFDRCQVAYFYDYILLEPRGTNKYAQLGNVVHEVLEKTDFDQPLNYFDMLEKFEDLRSKYDPKDEITDDLLDIGRHILAEFVQERKETKWQIVAKEMPFAIIVGPALVVGYIDRVDELGNTIIISDYKTGRQEVPHKDVPYNFQLGIYALAMKKQFPNHRIIAQLDYLRSGRIKSHEFTNVDLKDMENRLIEAINLIIETTDFKYTPNKSHCYWCNHAKTVCPVGIKRLEK